MKRAALVIVSMFTLTALAGAQGRAGMIDLQGYAVGFFIGVILTTIVIEWSPWR